MTPFMDSEKPCHVKLKILWVSKNEKKNTHHYAYSDAYAVAAFTDQSSCKAQWDREGLRRQGASLWILMAELLKS